MDFVMQLNHFIHHHIKKEMKVTIVVLSDIGRSPRMVNHAFALMKAFGKDADQLRLDVVCLQGEKSRLNEYDSNEPLASSTIITTNATTTANTATGATVAAPVVLNSDSKAKVYFHYLKDINTNRTRMGMPRAVLLVIKGIYALASMFYYLLFSCSSPDVMILQNPPAIPALAVMIIVARIHGLISFVTSFGKIKHQPIVIIDWHNLGFSMFEMKYRKNHLIVKGARLYEKYLSQYADLHFTVTDAMKIWLNQYFKLPSNHMSVLYDKPPDTFHQLTKQEKIAFLSSNKIKKLIGWNEGEKIIISSTSWTPDEDFSILKEAIKLLQKETDQTNLPVLRFVITGKGPLRESFEKEIESILDQSQKVYVKFAWVEAADYPLLVGCADLGICLHTSTSGLDLPMKVVDLFGAGVPCLAVHFSCLDELVKHNENGLVFKDANELASQVVHLFSPLKQRKLELSSIDVLQEGALKWSSRRWQQEWEEKALPHILNMRNRNIKFDSLHALICVSFLAIFTLIAILLYFIYPTLVLALAPSGMYSGLIANSYSKSDTCSQLN